MCCACDVASWVLFGVVLSFISFVCLLALSHLLEIVCLSKGNDDGGKETEWELFCSYSLSGSRSLFVLNVLEAGGTCALLSPPARGPIALGIFLAMWHDAGRESSWSLLVSNGTWRAVLKLHRSVHHLQVTVLALVWKCSWRHIC